jgi:hypothetical protein
MCGWRRPARDCESVVAGAGAGAVAVNVVIDHHSIVYVLVAIATAVGVPDHVAVVIVFGLHG